MIAEYQVDKLRQRLSQQVRDIIYHSFSKMKKVLTFVPGLSILMMFGPS
jgi:uncharacterized protein YybS (DUF2232 family)